MKKFKKGDRVRVWSLQSWHEGGFLNGEPAVVKQDQTRNSVILAVVRKFNGEYKLDESYEVYHQQCELMDKENSKPKLTDYDIARQELERFHMKLIKE